MMEPIVNLLHPAQVTVEFWYGGVRMGSRGSVAL